jgi:hypothetical protein
MTYYDYTNQAWVNDLDVYIRCGHPSNMDCGCYGRLHAGELASPEVIAEYRPPEHCSLGCTEKPTKQETRQLARGKRLLDWFIRSEAFEYWQQDHLSNQLFLSDPERANRIHEAAEYGCDGSTHAERIQDRRDAWRDYLADRTAWTHPERVDNAMHAAIDACWDWHHANGSLEQEIG